MANLYLSILRALGIPKQSFADTPGTLANSIETLTTRRDSAPTR